MHRGRINMIEVTSEYSFQLWFTEVWPSLQVLNLSYRKPSLQSGNFEWLFDKELDYGPFILWQWSVSHLTSNIKDGMKAFIKLHIPKCKPDYQPYVDNYLVLRNILVHKVWQKEWPHQKETIWQKKILPLHKWESIWKNRIIVITKHCLLQIKCD